jgi:hypothetical protein
VTARTYTLGRRHSMELLAREVMPRAGASLGGHQGVGAAADEVGAAGLA